jgi:hypothetical protein
MVRRILVRTNPVGAAWRGEWVLRLISDMFWFWVTGALMHLVERLDKNARLNRLLARGLGWNPEHVASLLSVFDPLDAGSRKKALSLYHEVATALIASCRVSERCSPAEIESAYFSALRQFGEYPPAFKRTTARLVSRLHALHAVAFRNWHAESW